jgi:3-oxoacyl-[acyl-carrier protein] reductase
MSEKNAVITGTSRGIGREMVYTFARNGYNIWACARQKSLEYEEELAELSEKTKVRITPVYFDMADEQEVKDAMKGILKEKRTVDVLINNAAVAHSGLLNMTSLGKMREVYEVNVFSQVLIMQLLSRQMIRQKSGSIINMCSAGGIEANPGYLAYGSSKAAIIWITRSVAKELAEYNIRVNGIAPGLIATDMGQFKSEEEREKVLLRTPMHRMGMPEEVAKAALYLASDDAAYITGHIMQVDGGRCS